MRSKLIDSARDLGLDINVRRVPDAASAECAAVVGCGPDRLVACAVYVADGEPVVCVAPTDAPVDSDRLADALDVAELRRASDAEIRSATGFAPAAVPPFGHGLPVVVDTALLDHRTVWVAGGDGHTLVELAPRRLASCTAAQVAAVTAVAA